MAVWPRAILLAFGFTAFAWLVHVFGRVLPDALAVGVWAGLAMPITWGLFTRRRLRRAAFVDAHIARASPLSRWLRRPWLMALISVLIGGLLALFLAAALVRLDAVESWIVLAAGAPAAVLTFQLAERRLARHVSAAYLPLAAWWTSVRLVGGIMLVSLVALAFHAPYPELGDVDLARAVWHFVDGEHARSGGVLLLLQLAAAEEGVRLWLAQQLMPRPGGSVLEALGWLAVLAEETVFVWSYLLYLSPIMMGASANGRYGIPRSSPPAR